MKKLFSALLAVAMILSMVAVMLTTVSAETLKALGESDIKDVNATYVPAQASPNVYSVDLAWGSLAFVYTEATVQWNPETKVYDTITPASWAPKTTDADKITVTNNSNAPVSIALTAAPEATGITLTWSVATINLDAVVPATDTAAAVVDSDSATLTVSGDLAETTGTVKLGTVTVTITSGN